MKETIMQIIKECKLMADESRQYSLRDAKVGFVATMGALHDAHLSLIARSKAENDLTVLSIFLNPAQFNDPKDLEKYPSNLKRDLAIAEASGVDIVFCPNEYEMYPDGYQTFVDVTWLSETLCGASRGKRHFIGVCTIVTKLFNLIKPTSAYFGLKDAQQAFILQRMVDDLNMNIQIEFCPTVRAIDGLALSSRNMRLADSLRPSMLRLYQALCLGRNMVKNGESNVHKLEIAMQEYILADSNCTLDYLEIVSTNTLRPIDTINGMVMIAGAMFINNVRLIDNVIFNSDGPWEDPPPFVSDLTLDEALLAMETVENELSNKDTIDNQVETPYIDEYNTTMNDDDSTLHRYQATTQKQ